MRGEFPERPSVTTHLDNADVSHVYIRRHIDKSLLGKCLEIEIKDNRMPSCPFAMYVDADGAATVLIAFIKCNNQLPRIMACLGTVHIGFIEFYYKIIIHICTYIVDLKY